MGPGSWNRRLGPAALSDCPFANRSPGLFWMFWLFLQLNNSQFSNCQIRNTRISTASVTPMLGIRAKGQVDPSKADFGTCSTCFIWCTSGSVLSTTLLAVFAIYTQIIAIAPARPIAQRSPSALSRSSMRREHCGNFSVADIVMSGEVLQRAGSYPRPAPRAARCSVLPYSRGNCSPLVSNRGPGLIGDQRRILARVKLTLVSDLTGVDRARRLLPDPKARQLPVAPALLALGPTPQSLARWWQFSCAG